MPKKSTEEKIIKFIWGYFENIYVYYLMTKIVQMLFKKQFLNTELQFYETIVILSMGFLCVNRIKIPYCPITTNIYVMIGINHTQIGVIHEKISVK